MESVHHATHKGMEHEQANELGTTILRVIEKIISVKFYIQIVTLHYVVLWFLRVLILRNNIIYSSSEFKPA